MKEYSTSKLLVAFVIVSLLLLPYAFAGKPDKPPKPQEEPVWSVYVPEYSLVDGVSVHNGLQGIPGTDFNGSNPATRNFVTFINHSYSYFNFEIFVDGSSPTLQVYFVDPETFICSPDYGVDSCDEMFAEIENIQPNGEYSQRIFFGFPSYSSYNYENQEYNLPQPIQDGYFYIDRSVYDPVESFVNTINGQFSGTTTITRESENVWHIVVCDPGIVNLQQRTGEVYTEPVCNNAGKNCRDVTRSYSAISAEGTVVLKPFDLYFVREPAQ